MALNRDPYTGASDTQCDELIAYANTLGITREQMAVIGGTLFVNHAMAIGLSLERCHAVVDGLFVWRDGRLPADSILVDAGS